MPKVLVTLSDEALERLDEVAGPRGRSALLEKLAMGMGPEYGGEPEPLRDGLAERNVPALAADENRPVRRFSRENAFVIPHAQLQVRDQRFQWFLQGGVNA